MKINNPSLKYISALVFDLDGTLYAGSETSRHTLKQYIDSCNDLQVIFCTGRSLEACIPILHDPLTPKPDNLICDVGATVYDKNLEYIEALQNRINDKWPGLQKVLKQLPFLNKLEIQSTPMINRISFNTNPEIHNKVMEQYKAELSKSNFTFIYSHKKFLDVLPNEVNKGTTLTALLNYLKIEKKSTIAFGDSDNDISMLNSGVHGYFLADADIESKTNPHYLSRIPKKGCDGIIMALNQFGSSRL